MYVQTWVVGQECGSDSIPGCQKAALDYLTNSSSFAFQSTSAAAFVTIGLGGADGEALDLASSGMLAGGGYTQVNSVCRPPARGRKLSESISLTFVKGFTAVKTSGGCLSADPRAEARAREK